MRENEGPQGAVEPKLSPRKKKPNIVHPAVPRAVGSRVSRYQEGRDMTEEARSIIHDTIERVRGTGSGGETDP